MNNSLISVVILTYRRRENLIRVLESVRAQAYEPREVIVVDNASGDGVVEFLKAEFPEVLLVSLRENIGCAGRNRGIAAAHGDIVVTIDNDVYFDSPFELQKIRNAFDHSPEASCIVFKVLEGDTGRVHLRDWCHPRSYWDYSDSEFETCFIPEGASAFRRADFETIGGYYEPLWIGCEGSDLALRMIDAGMKIAYRPEVRVRHAMSQETRSSGRNFYFYTRNYLWIAFKDYSGLRRWRYLAYHWGMMAFFSLRAGHPGKFFLGVRDGLAGLRKLQRTRISAKGWRRLDEITAERPGLFLRLRKHRERPLV
ncbi:MAG TPA: glycosyltransferase family 2 protein [Candidatus Acidoferrales bacterium]|nr:glycosyltransferase family 2 protein [Candidatus Acidoferrales bacterium]